MSYIFVIVLKY